MQYVTGLRPEIFEWARVESPPASALSIAVNGTVWAVGREPAEGGFGVIRWTGRTWVGAGIGAVAVAAAPRGDAWLLTDAGRILRPTGLATWTDAGAEAIDVSVGADGSVWIIAPADGKPGAGRILRWNGREDDPHWQAGVSEQRPYAYPHALPWTQSDVTDLVAGPVAPVKLAVAADGLPWVIDSDGAIYRRLPGAWQLIAEEPATEIAIGYDGNVWIIGEDERPGGRGVYRYYHGTDWDCYEGAGVKIAVDPDGLPWRITTDGTIHNQHVRL